MWQLGRLLVSAALAYGACSAHVHLSIGPYPRKESNHFVTVGRGVGRVIFLTRHGLFLQAWHVMISFWVEIGRFLILFAGWQVRRSVLTA